MPRPLQPEVVERAKRLLAEHRYEEALAFLEDALTRFPDDPEVRLQYATALVPFRMEDVSAQVRLAIDLEPNNPWRLARAASLMFHADELDAAREYVVRAIRHAPADFDFAPELAHLGGRLALLAGEHDAAGEAFEAAFEADRDYFPFVRELVQHRTRHGRMREAHEIASAALLRQPENEDLLELRRWLEDQAGA